MADISKLVKYLTKKYGPDEAQRLERAADEVPRLEEQYTDLALRRIFNPIAQAPEWDAASKYLLPITTLKTNEYDEIGWPMDYGKRSMKKMENVRTYLEAGGFDQVPIATLEQVVAGSIYDPPYGPVDLYKIMQHDGRHRMRALAEKGYDKTIMGLAPQMFVEKAAPWNDAHWLTHSLPDRGLGGLKGMLTRLKEVDEFEPYWGNPRANTGNPLNFSDYFKPFAKGGLAQIKDHHAY